MPVTVAQLGARALRKLGLGIVANADRQPSGPTYTQADVTNRVLRNLGIIVPADQRPASLGTVTQAEVARRMLRSLGVNPVADAPDLGPALGSLEIALRALRALGIDPKDFRDVGTGTVRSVSDVVIEALRRLEVIAADEPAAVADLDYAHSRAMSVHDMLAALDYVDWTQDAIPNSVFEAYIALTANLLAPAYGKAASDETAAAAREMIRFQALSGTIALQRADYRVQAVHDAVVAEGLADWDVTSIPDAVSEAYVALTVAALAATYSKQVDSQAPAAALATIKRIVLSGSRGQAIAVAKAQSVHDALVAQRIAGWDVNSIPVAYAEDYVTLGVATLAPVYGQKVEGPVFESVVARIKGAEHIRTIEDSVEQKVASFQSELNALGLVSWTPDAIPGAVVDAFATAATVLMGIENGKLDPQAMDGAFQRVRRVAMMGPAGQALAEQKVRAVHYDLEARGRVRWTLLDVPRYAEEPYVLLAASLLAPEVGERADPSWGPGAEMALARVTSLPSAGRPVVATYF